MDAVRSNFAFPDFMDQEKVQLLQRIRHTRQKTVTLPSRDGYKPML